MKIINNKKNYCIFESKLYLSIYRGFVKKKYELMYVKHYNAQQLLLKRESFPNGVFTRKMY